MKVNFVLTTVSILISALISYGFYSFHEGSNKNLITTGSFILLTCTLITATGVNFNLSRTTINIKITAGIFFIISLAENLVFSIFNFSTPFYIIINGIIILIFLTFIYSLNKSKQ